MSGHFRSKPVSDGMAFILRLSSSLYCYLFYVQGKARKNFGIRRSFKDLVFCHWRLILRSNWALTRFQESGDLCEFLRRDYLASGGHVHASVNDADHDVALGKLIANIS